MTLFFEKVDEEAVPGLVRPYVPEVEFLTDEPEENSGTDPEGEEAEETEETVTEEEAARDAEEEEREQLEKWKAAYEEEYKRKIAQAEEILNAAQEEAVRLREEATRTGREEGYAAGKQQGYDEGYADGEQRALEAHQEEYQNELDYLQEQVTGTIRDMGNLKDKVLEQYLDNLKDISLAVAEKIIHTSLKSSSEIIKRMIVVSTEKLKKVAWAKIYIGRNESGINIQGDAELMHELTKLSDNVKIVVMNEEPGTCIIELPSEIIDVSAGTQLENIRGILENARL